MSPRLISHFRVAVCLRLKASSGAQPFKWYNPGRPFEWIMSKTQFEPVANSNSEMAYFYITVTIIPYPICGIILFFLFLLRTRNCYYICVQLNFCCHFLNFSVSQPSCLKYQFSLSCFCSQLSLRIFYNKNTGPCIVVLIFFSCSLKHVLYKNHFVLREQYLQQGSP